MFPPALIYLLSQAEMAPFSRHNAPRRFNLSRMKTFELADEMLQNLLFNCRFVLQTNERTKTHPSLFFLRKMGKKYSNLFTFMTCGVEQES